MDPGERQAHVPHGAQIGVAEHTANLDRVGALDRDPIQLEVGAGLGFCAGQEGRATVEAHQVAQMALVSVQIAVPIEVLCILAPVPSGTRRLVLADCKNATTLAFAGLNPDAARVGLVVPDFTEQGIGLLIELVESPFLAGRCTHTACITEGVGEEGVLTDRAQVNDQCEFLCPRGIELDELRLGQVEPVRGKRGRDGSPG